jgi:hypothetical protein
MAEPESLPMRGNNRHERVAIPDPYCLPYPVNNICGINVGIVVAFVLFLIVFMVLPKMTVRKSTEALSKSHEVARPVVVAKKKEEDNKKDDDMNPQQHPVLGEDDGTEKVARSKAKQQPQTEKVAKKKK